MVKMLYSRGASDCSFAVTVLCSVKNGAPS
jgi:hypothetical protein